MASRYEMECGECGGSGYVDISGEGYAEKEDYCPNCEGDGVIPNAEGLELLVFIRRYLDK